jgi:hypothetical protein
MGEMLPRGEKFLASILAEAEGHFRRAVRGFQDRLGVAIETALGLHFSGATFQAEVEPPRFPDIRVDKTFDIPLDMVWFLVPMPVFRRLVYRRLRSQLPWEVEKNLTRLGGQWNEAAKTSIESMSRQAQEFMEREATTVIELATSSEDKRERIKAAMASCGQVSIAAQGPGWSARGGGRRRLGPAQASTMSEIYLVFVVARSCLGELDLYPLRLSVHREIALGVVGGMFSTSVDGVD